jgi:hypothetical protein
METQAVKQQTTYEQTVITIMRKLPPDRLPYLVEFARFLEFQTTKAGDLDWLEESPENEAKWDELFARPESQRLLREMAREARAEYLAGNTTGIQITEDGRLAPE